MVESLPSKQVVAGSSPVSRSTGRLWLTLEAFNIIAVKAFPVVHGYQVAASPTGVFLILLLQKAIQAIIPDFYQVLNHAHTEFTPVSAIETLQTLTGKAIAFEAEIHLAPQ